ncbi:MULTISPECIES: hypothetical protein [Micromonospora]|uniref:DUF4190 domain-containing protein n=1 Tax=Micromonospora yangpuensis TaxID=683228 RepID=A0A1C6UCL0_9ACTN|nr:hypothetical protein [Micromonospora yangpuensis]GGM26201.1 hypothetical protein GCM10012279_50980 [Micromonospora yangpuensis]SCL51762.1 hypothetical protein GA0070617_1879 [Micromonospora yangpuensis]
MANIHTGTRGRSNTSTARILTIAGFVFAAIGIFVFPLLFGLIAVGLGVAGALQGDKPLGWYAAAAGVGAILLNMILGALIMSS